MVNDSHGDSVDRQITAVRSSYDTSNIYQIFSSLSCVVKQRKNPLRETEKDKTLAAGRRRSWLRPPAISSSSFSGLPLSAASPPHPPSSTPPTRRLRSPAARSPAPPSPSSNQRRNRTASSRSAPPRHSLRNATSTGSPFPSPSPSSPPLMPSRPSDLSSTAS